MGQETRSFDRGVVGGTSAKYAEHFYRRVPITKPSYETDGGDLLPKPKKIGRVAVAMAEAETLTVTSHDRETATYAATELPTIQFKGKLAIAEVPDEDVVEAEAIEPSPSLSTPNAAEDTQGARTNETAAPVEQAVVEKGVHHIPVVHRKGRKTLHAYTNRQQATLTPLYNPDGIIGMQRARITDRNPRQTTIKVDARLVDARPIISPWVVVVSGMAALLIAVGLMSVTSSVAVTADSTGQTYGLTPLVTLLNLIKTELTALLVHSF
jgi:hypothetical protein